MNFRAWRYEDIKAIEQIERASFTDPWNFQMFADSFFNEAFVSILAEDNGKVVAYGGAYCVYETGDIMNIAVDEAYQKRGVARKMLDELCFTAKQRGVERMTLEVRVSNRNAIVLYSRYGFVGLYCRTRYYADGEDAIVMELKL